MMLSGTFSACRSSWKGPVSGRNALSCVFVMMCGVCGACLYTEEIGPPVHTNQEPYFYNWIPSETTVTVGAAGATFYAYPTDPDEADAPLLEMQWYLNGREQGNGNQVKVWLEDLGAEGTGVLAATVVDPYDAQDSLIWRLEAAPVSADADLGGL